MEREIDRLSRDEFDAVAGGMMNNGQGNFFSSPRIRVAPPAAAFGAIS
jgi:hypothetical protein